MRSPVYALARTAPRAYDFALEISTLVEILFLA